jgi:peptidoglycan/xylan/chitin deacetylase (PgdA/CDA1 family)
VTSDTEPVVFNGNPVSNSGIYQAMNNGAVRVTFWIASPISTHVYLNTNAKQTTVTIPYSNADQAGADPCKKSCNCVAFRLDDIQDYYMEKTTAQLMQLFKGKNNAPLTVGVIGGVFGSNGDTNTVLLMKQVIADTAWNIEVANHGQNHEDFTLLSKEEQKNKLLFTNNKILEKTGVNVKTFIPPFNQYNQATVEALQELGFTRFSAQLTTDPRPIPLEGQTLYHYPIGASTTDLYKEGFVPVSFDKTWGQIQAQLTQDGFASVMMHPYEFGEINPNDPNGFIDQPNTARINGLSALIDQIKAAGLKIVTYSQIVNELSVPSTPMPTTIAPNVTTSVPPVTTAAPNVTTSVPPVTTAAPNVTTSVPTTISPTKSPKPTTDPITNKNQSKNNDSNDALIIAGSVIGACVVIGIVVAAILLVLRKKQKKLMFSNGQNNASNSKKDKRRILLYIPKI